MSKLSPIEVEKFAEITRALSEEQRKVVLANIRTTDLYSELERRTRVASARLAELDKIISDNSQPEMTLLEMQHYFKQLKGVLL